MLSQIAGVARKFKVPKQWHKHAGDERPCAQPGCPNEGYFVPTVIVWGANDPKRTGRSVLVMIPMVLCTEHATLDPKEFRPDDQALQYLREQLGAEPALDTMVIQYHGNKACKVDRALELAGAAQGAYEPWYDPADGVVKTRKVG